MKKYFFSFLCILLCTSAHGFQGQIEASEKEISEIESLVENKVLDAKEMSQQYMIMHLNYGLKLVKVSDNCLLGERDVSASCQQERKQATNKLVAASALFKRIQTARNQQNRIEYINSKADGFRLLGVREDCLTTKLGTQLGFADLSNECNHAREEAFETLNKCNNARIKANVRRSLSQ